MRRNKNWIHSKTSYLRLCFLFIFLSSCNSTKLKFDKNMLYGYWITTNNEKTSSDKIINENDFYIILQSEQGIDSVEFNYKIQKEKIIIYSGQNLVSKNKIIKLTKDSLVYKRIGDNEIFRYKRKS